MKEEHLGKLKVRLVGGIDGQGGGHGPIVILLHGYGAPGDDLVPLGHALHRTLPVRFLFPEAPLRLPDGFSNGRAWWMLDMEKIARDLESGRGRDTFAVPQGLLQARTAILGLLDHLEQEWKISTTQVVLGGFSQGAMLACDIVLHTERPFAGLVMLSGTLIAQEEWERRIPGRKGLPVFQSHGTQDPLLAFPTAEHLRDLLLKAGIPVDWHPFRGGHEIPHPVLEALRSFLQGRFS